MLPAFQINNFRPWTPLPTKPFPPHRTLTACSPRIQSPPSPEPYHVPPPSTLPLLKHHLPARPPPEVCVHVSANTQLESEQSSFLEKSGNGAASQSNSVPHAPALDLIHHCDPQDTAGTLAEPPGVQGDYRARDLPSPSTSGSADSLEEFLRLPDVPHDDIPVDPLLLADLGPWKPDDLQLLETPVDGLINPDTTGQYPEPPEILHSPTNPSGDPGERDGI
ncbi:hypothetical protein BDW75DRAFT_246506 [Aspergillus navahoensis]